MSNGARVMKTIAFPLEQWAAIERLMRETGTIRFTDVCRLALSEMADRRGIKWPTDTTSTAA